MANVTPDLKQKTVSHQALPCWQATVLTLFPEMFLDH